jgi:hypothetical protein
VATTATLRSSSREPRAEDLEEVEVGREQAGGRRGDGEPGDEHGRQHVSRAAGSGGARDIARAQAIPEPRQEEDRVVGDDPEQEHDEHGLDLARNREPVGLAEPAQDPNREQVGDRDRREVDERRPQRSEVDGDR